MRPLYQYTLAGVTLLFFATVIFSGNGLSAIQEVGSRYLVGATDYLAVYVNNPNVAPPDTQAPVVTLIGAPTVQLTVGDTYTEQGATSTDNVDSNLPIQIFVDGSASSTSVYNTFINTSVPGTHTVLYKATDTAGNVGSATRTVVVSAALGGGGTSGGGGSSFSGAGGGAVVLPTNIPPVVPPKTACAAKSKGDLNCDGKVNLVDFSVLAYWYKRPLTAAAIAQGVDINGDDKVTLADFSILAYYWTK